MTSCRNLFYIFVNAPDSKIFFYALDYVHVRLWPLSGQLLQALLQSTDGNDHNAKIVAYFKNYMTVLPVRDTSSLQAV